MALGKSAACVALQRELSGEVLTVVDKRWWVLCRGIAALCPQRGLCSAVKELGVLPVMGSFQAKNSGKYNFVLRDAAGTCSC